jgi:hypothetical protein
MELVLTRTTNVLWNRTENALERIMTVEQLQNCGWFLRKRVERSLQIEYTLEYHGKVKCARCKGYIWPVGMHDKCKVYRMCIWRKGHLGNGSPLVEDQEQDHWLSG